VGRRRCSCPGDEAGDDPGRRQSWQGQSNRDGPRASDRGGCSQPELVDVHDFPDDAVGKAVPYGVYDVAANDGFVSVGTDHDTPVFAVTSVEAWWKRVGSPRYPGARELFITADAGGSNRYRPRVWKHELQRVADKTGPSIRVSHFPPGTSKWNKVEHRLFSFISMNWRGRPLRTFETIVNLISNTTNRGGLVVRARLDRRNNPSARGSPRRSSTP
jgi:hypothetical protein